jgi:membrane protease YdiL (CAAX protease family)
MEMRETNRSSRWIQCWLEFLIVAIGVPVAIWIVSKLVSFFIPAATSPEKRYILWISGSVVQWLFVIALLFVLRSRGSSFKNLGVWRMGTWPAWIVALIFAILSIVGNFQFFHQIGLPISYASFPRGFYIIAGLLMAITAGFCEEVLYRAFLMTGFANAGYGKILQVLIPSLAFGFAHARYPNQGFAVWLDIMLPTAFSGVTCGIVYLLGRRSLVPVFVAHIVIDSIELPWLIMFYMTTGAWRL